MLAAWAEATSRVEIGALVTCNSYRNPELLADMARTVDHISDGRLILGIGSGWFQRDYDEYGYDFGTAGGRLADLAEALPAYRAAVGRAEPAADAPDPGAHRRGGERKTLRLVAQHADIWHGFGDVETLRRKSGVLDDWCAREGRTCTAAIVRTTWVGPAGTFDRGDSTRCTARASASSRCPRAVRTTTWPD